MSGYLSRWLEAHAIAALDSGAEARVLTPSREMLSPCHAGCFRATLGEHSVREWAMGLGLGEFPKP